MYPCGAASDPIPGFSTSRRTSGGDALDSRGRWRLVSPRVEMVAVMTEGPERGAWPRR